MPRRSKTKIPENDASGLIGDLVGELNTAAEKISAALGEETIPPPPPPMPVGKDNKDPPQDPEEIDRKRKELLTLVSDGVISKSVAYINQASSKIVEKVYAEYEAKCLERELQSYFSAAFGGFDPIATPEELEKELKSDPLLRKDLKVAMAWLTPLVPFLGVLSGGLTVGKYVWNKQSSDVADLFARGPNLSHPVGSERTDQEKEVASGYNTI